MILEPFVTILDLNNHKTHINTQYTSSKHYFCALYYFER